MDVAQSNMNPPVTVMPWFLGAIWITKFDGDKAKFAEWRVQVEAMLWAQGLTRQQQADFVLYHVLTLGALEGDAKRELQLITPRDKGTGQKVLDILQRLYTKPATKCSW